MSKLKMKGRFSGAEVIWEDGELICDEKVKQNIENMAAGVESTGCGVFIGDYYVCTEKILSNPLSAYALIHSMEPVDLLEGELPEIPEHQEKFGEEEKADMKKSKEFNILKSDPEKRLVFGWASVAIGTDGKQLEDLQGDMIDPEDLEEAAYNYVLDFRDTGEEHIPTKRMKGKLVESCVLTEEKQRAMGIPAGSVPVGWWIGFKIFDDNAWELVKNGTYRMFSVEGVAERLPVEKSGPTGCGVIVLRNGKVLAGTRNDPATMGQIGGPGGHIEPGETPEQAARREAMEEFNISCKAMTALGTTKDGSSAVFVCEDFYGEPACDEVEMSDARWMDPAEITESDAFPPFYESLQMSTLTKKRVAKTFEEIMNGDMPMGRYDTIHEIEKSRYDTIVEIEKFNPYHGKDGRFASASGSTSFTYAPGKSKAHDAAIARAKVRDADIKAVSGGIQKVRDSVSNEANPIERKGANIDDIMKEGGCDRATAEQAAEKAKAVFDKAAEAEPRITEDIVSAVAEKGGKMYGLEFRMKQETSLARKIVTDAKSDFGGDMDAAAADIKDAVRYTAVFEAKDFTAGYMSVKSALESKGYTEERCKNFYEMYNAGNSQQKAVQCVYSDKSGTRFELQFHTYESQGAKEVNHPLYEKYRAASTGVAERKEADARMKNISSTVPDPDGVYTIQSHK